LVRRPRSEYEFRDKLERGGWVCLLAPGSLGAVDLVAVRRIRSHPFLFLASAFQVKETRGSTLYVDAGEVRRLEEFERRTRIPTFLVVKFKRVRGRRLVWRVAEPACKITCEGA